MYNNYYILLIEFIPNRNARKFNIKFIINSTYSGKKKVKRNVVIFYIV